MTTPNNLNDLGNSEGAIRERQLCAGCGHRRSWHPYGARLDPTAPKCWGAGHHATDCGCPGFTEESDECMWECTSRYWSEALNRYVTCEEDAGHDGQHWRGVIGWLDEDAAPPADPTIPPGSLRTKLGFYGGPVPDYSGVSHEPRVSAEERCQIDTWPVSGYPMGNTEHRRVETSVISDRDDFVAWMLREGVETPEERRTRIAQVIMDAMPTTGRDAVDAVLHAADKLIEKGYAR